MKRLKLRLEAVWAVLTFKLGCQEFTKEDIVAVRNAFPSN